MSNHVSKIFEWAIVGAGPAGLATAGLLLDSGVKPDDIAIVDPHFKVGDFGAYWGEVYSNTSVGNFLDFLTQIQSFHFSDRTEPFDLEAMQKADFFQLKKVTEALQWITHHLEQRICFHYSKVESLHINAGNWHAVLEGGHAIQSKKIILATGSDPKSLSYPNIKEIDLYDALNPVNLRSQLQAGDVVAVFGSSHSSMIIMKNLLDLGVKKVINFYLMPHRYAVNMGDWTLYDNTGLKGLTAQWVHQNISENLDPRIGRYISNDVHINQHLYQCNKAVYPIGFKARSPEIQGIDVQNYDPYTGIIAPGLFGTGIAFPQVTIDPFGNKELNVGLYKFMQDIKKALPIWKRYDI
jgi:cation diffusion facilitator CzcD-associated flavoprotein CzcO